MNQNQPLNVKLLFIDLETFPLTAYCWQRWQTNVIDVEQESCIATFAAKWAGSRVFSRSLPDYKGYKPGSYDDSKLVRDLWKLYDEADIVCAHNGDAFDHKVSTSRFIYHGLCPPSPYKTVDTKKVAKRVGRFSSNKLDDLGKLLGEGQKIKTDFELWKGCMNGDPEAWRKMIRYNERDTVLLEKVYNRLLPYMHSHPNLNVYDPNAGCPKCGSSKVQSRGTAITLNRVYPRYQCTGCGGWLRGITSEGRALRVNL